MWLNRNDEFTLDGGLVSVTEESLGDNRGFVKSRDQKHVCAACCKGQSSSFSKQASMSRAQGCRRTEVKLRSRRRGRREREELRSSLKIKNDEYEVMRTVLRNWCNSCVRGRAKQSHRCATSDPSRPSMAKDCRVSTRNVNENSPTVLVLCKRTHGVERDCRVSHEATEPHAGRLCASTS